MPRLPTRSEPLQWATAMFGSAALGDQRRTNRLVQLAADLAREPGVSLPKACGLREAAMVGGYRFVRNPAIDPEAIGEAGWEVTATRAAACHTLVEIQDTTTLSYAHQVEGLGDLGGRAESSKRGLWVHTSLLVDADNEETVGIVDQTSWIREPGTRGKRHQRKQRAYEDKESFKWQRTTERVRARLGPEVMSHVVSVSDRESDLFQYLWHKQTNDERFAIRACWNRNVRPEGETWWSTLWEVRKEAPIVGILTLEVPQRAGRPARQADLTIRAMRLGLQRPTNLRAAYPAEVEVNVVVACEERPGPGVTAPLEWILLTTEPIETPEQVLQVLSWYRLRWRIEEFHKAWKSGAGVERPRLQDPQNLVRMALSLAFVAVRLLQLQEHMTRDPEAPCEPILEPIEWKVLWKVVEQKPVPKKVPSVTWALYALARLAGWSDTKRTGRVGWATLWRGWLKLQERVEGFCTAVSLGKMKI